MINRHVKRAGLRARSICSDKAQKDKVKVEEKGKGKSIMKKDISGYLKKRKIIINKELDNLLAAEKGHLKTIYTAMNYALKGGKRIRPILCLACAEAAGGKVKDALKAACAIEIVHSYSLIHDDLPCMDNDDYRRGRLSCHKKFGIASAVLTGDALLTYAFNILCFATKNPYVNMQLVEALSHASGTCGMIGGQAADISTAKKDFAAQEYINIRKTGALIAASCKMGALSVKAKNKDIASLLKFGEHVGLIFQIVDDILDNEGLAKIMSKKHALEYAKNLTQKAKDQIASFGKNAEPLREIANLLINRTH